MRKKKTDPPESGSSCWNRWLEGEGGGFFLYARQQTRTESDAKDVLQDALMEAWRAEDGRIPGRGLVFTIIRRRAIDLGRSIDRRKRREQDFASDETSWFEPDYSTPDVEDSLASAVRNLPDKLREVVLLRIWGGLTFPEIAELTETRLATTTSRYRYALERLRECKTLSELKV